MALVQGSADIWQAAASLARVDVSICGLGPWDVMDGRVVEASKTGMGPSLYGWQAGKQDLHPIPR